MGSIPCESLAFFHGLPHLVGNVGVLFIDALPVSAMAGTIIIAANQLTVTHRLLCKHPRALYHTLSFCLCTHLYCMLVFVLLIATSLQLSDGWSAVGDDSSRKWIVSYTSGREIDYMVTTPASNAAGGSCTCTSFASILWPCPHITAVCRSRACI